VGLNFEIQAFIFNIFKNIISMEPVIIKDLII